MEMLSIEMPHEVRLLVELLAIKIFDSNTYLAKNVKLVLLSTSADSAPHHQLPYVSMYVRMATIGYLFDIDGAGGFRIYTYQFLLTSQRGIYK